MATPAWKRLGLKLKYANEIPEKVHTNGKTTTQTQGAQPEESRLPSAEPLLKKRKTDRRSKENSLHTLSSSSPPPSVTNNDSEKAPKKQVSFSVDTKPATFVANGNATDDDLEAVTVQTSTKGKKNKKSGKKSQQPHAQKSNAALDYLNNYRTARSTWKFNKNRETWILKHILSENDISRDYDLALAEYIHGLQGTAARERLKTQCVGLLKKEAITQNGAGSPEEDSSQHAQYAQRFRDQLEKPSTSEPSDDNDDEAKQEYSSWIQQQPRSTLLLWALGLDDKTLLLNGSASKSKTQTGYANGVGIDAKAKKRKNRTAVVDYDSSSSDSTSSSSESDSESDDEKDVGKTLILKEDTSSSGSDEESSSDESGSSTEVESDES